MDVLRGLAMMQIGAAMALAVTAHNRTSDPRTMAVMAVTNVVLGLLLLAIAAYLDRRKTNDVG